jgi:MFS family permease
MFVRAGLFKHSQELSRAFLADITPRSQHPRVYGHFNSISNIGFILGPIIGGHIVDGLGGFHAVAFATAASFLVDLRNILLPSYFYHLLLLLFTLGPSCIFLLIKLI